MHNDVVQETIRRYEQYVNPAVARLFRFMGLASVERSARGLYIYDAQGQPYLDCLGGYGVFSLGHANEEIVAAVKKQMDLMPMSGKILLNEHLGRLSELLAEIIPGARYSFIVNSGAEAVEGALKLARIHTGRSKFIAMQNSFHGKTLGALSATGRDMFADPFRPLLDGFIHVPFNDIGAVRRAIGEDTAAVIAEPIQGEGGIIVPDDGYLTELRNLCDSRGSLLILDEVQTGLGRTGKLFASEYDGAEADITVTAKALGGGVMPIGAFSAREKVWNKYIESPFLHTSTFGGNPLACAAAIAVIEILKRDYASFSVAEKGGYFLKRLTELKERHPGLIKDARGRGLMIGLELTKAGIGGFLMSECMKKRLMVAYTLNNPKVIRIEPPFMISVQTIDEAISILAEIFERAESMAADF